MIDMKNDKANRAVRQTRMVKTYLPKNEIKGVMCGWADCDATAGNGGLPEGWVWLLTFNHRHKVDATGEVSVYSPHVEHDMALCPEHALAFERCLKFGAQIWKEPTGQQ
jgi:hypothetical protein